MNSIALQLWLLAATFFGVSGLIHHLDIRNDRRSTFEIETFGFVENGLNLLLFLRCIVHFFVSI